MKSIIESIWDNYQVEISEALTKEVKEAQHKGAEIQNKLYASLDDSQKVLLEEYTESQNILQSLTDKNCFIDGVKFGIQLILDATTDNR